MKKPLSLLLVLVMLLALTATGYAAEGLANFQKVKDYTEGQFSDVPAGSKWAANVRAVYELGLMDGTSGTRFDTEGNLTMAQTIAMACRMHSIYFDIDAAFPASEPWYQPYVDYAVEYEIISVPAGFDGFNEPVSRGDFAGVLWSSLPDEALAEINHIEDGAIPDVPEWSDFYVPAYCLYRAGVLTGNDAAGTFAPESSINRGAAAAILSRMADPSLRRQITLEKKAFQPVPMDQLANRKSLQKKATDEQLAQAYDAAVELVTPYAGLSREDQLYGIAVSLREIFEENMTYSMEADHYNDPYGYFILGSASCAGCTRATGLCLNILGIPYEHVNENQYSHQWCRVNIGGTYWICDAYGLYCGPEPAPYEHPYLS